MSTKDPFADKQSPFGGRKNTNATPPAENTGFPQKPVQSGNVPLPQKPAFPGFPVAPTGSAQTPEPTAPITPGAGIPQIPVPDVFTPKFTPLTNKPARGSSDDLFPQAQEPVEDETVFEDDDEFDEELEELSLDDVYTDIFGEELPADADNYEELTEEEELVFEKRMVAADDEAAGPSLYALADDEDETVRAFVAMNLNAPSLLLDKLARDPESEVRENVLANPNCSQQTYSSFVRDPDDFIVAMWIENPRTTAEMLQPLYTTTDPFIGRLLIESAVVPEPVKAQLRRNIK